MLIVLSTLVALAAADADADADANAAQVQASSALSKPVARVQRRPNRPPAYRPARFDASKPVPVSRRTVRASFAPMNTRLKALLTTEGWATGPTGNAKADFSDLLSIVSTNVTQSGRSYVVIDGLDAAQVTTQVSSGWGRTEYTRTHYRVEPGEGDTAAVAFGMMRTTHGRGISTTSMDVMLLLDDEGRVSDVFASESNNWGGLSRERHLVFSYNADGDVERIEETRLNTNAAEAGEEPNGAYRYTWTPS